MLVYLAATALSCWFAWRAEKAERKWLWWIAAALPLVLVAAMRWGVGTDVRRLYWPQFMAVQAHFDGTTFPHARMLWRNFNLEEPAYRWLVRGIVACGGSFRWFLTVTSLLTGALVSTAIFRQSRSPALAFYFYVATSNYFLSLNIVRQYVAVGFVLLAVGFAVDRRFAWFALCMVAAAFFHRSALLALPVGVLPFVNVRLRWCFVAVAVALVSASFLVPAVKWALPRVGLKIYVKYFTARVSKDGFEWFFFAINVCFMALGAWYFKRASAQSRLFPVWYYMTVLGTVALAFSGVMPLMKRVNYYYAAPQFLMLPEMLAAEENPRMRKLMTIAAVLAFAAETVVAVVLLNKNRPLPYRIF